MDYGELAKLAIKAQKSSYSPYSNFKVGAALLTKDGKVYEGCNIENAAYTPTNCAERTAIFKAVSEGHREFEAIAVSGGYEGKLQYCFPCGVCRQVFMEFCNPKTFKVIIVKSQNEFDEFTLEEVLPFGFGPENLK